MQDHVEYTHDWVKSELSDPKFRSKTVKLKTDYKREKKSMTKLKYEQTDLEEFLDDFE